MQAPAAPEVQCDSCSVIIFAARRSLAPPKWYTGGGGGGGNLALREAAIRRTAPTSAALAAAPQADAGQPQRKRFRGPLPPGSLCKLACNGHARRPACRGCSHTRRGAAVAHGPGLVWPGRSPLSADRQAVSVEWAPRAWKFASDSKETREARGGTPGSWVGAHAAGAA